MEPIRGQAQPETVDKPQVTTSDNVKAKSFAYIQFIKGGRYSSSIPYKWVADSLKQFVRLHGDPSDTASAQIWEIGKITMEGRQEKSLSLYTERDAKNRLIWRSTKNPEWRWPMYKS